MSKLSSLVGALRYSLCSLWLKEEVERHLLRPPVQLKCRGISFDFQQKTSYRC
jgi:hypothetical protein